MEGAAQRGVSGPEAYRVLRAGKLLGKDRRYGEEIPREDFSSVGPTVVPTLVSQGIIEPVDATPDRLASIEKAIHDLAAAQKALTERLEALLDGSAEVRRGRRN